MQTNREGESEHNQLAALLLSYTRQIGLGMVCLQLKQYIHRDLAARNVLMSKNGLCKVCVCNTMPLCAGEYNIDTK